MNPTAVLDRMLNGRLDERAREWLEREKGGNSAPTEFCLGFAKASRYMPGQALSPTAGEQELAEQALPGWNPERWTTLEAVRARLLMARSEAASATLTDTVAECFRYADQGELVALYRSLPLLPDGRRFLWRAGEGCRSNMSVVFDAMACDNPYPFVHFDDTAWHQLVIKAVFIDAPLWRVHGLDRRLSEELAHMALDLADERRSAGRLVPPQLWLCLGSHGGRRALDALSAELTRTEPVARAAAALGLARAGRSELVAAALAGERDARTTATMEQACKGRGEQGLFATLGPTAGPLD
ncbi:MAG: EboA domain-containing protein [Deltaproteobacteria bacterium]